MTYKAAQNALILGCTAMLSLGIQAQGNGAGAARRAAASVALPGLQVESVLPSVADPAIKTTFDDASFAILPKGEARPELVLLLPATGAKPGQYQQLLGTIAEGGFHVIGLMYNNRPPENNVCDSTGDVECHRAFREERFAGDAPKALVQNTMEEGINHRLVMLLKYLDKEHPKDGWGKYLAGEEPAWKKIMISGHSQGSGHAAYIAKYHEVARVVLFSGPYDGVNLRSTPKLSKWLSEDSKTPPERWFAEYHQKDLGAPIPPMTLAALKVPKDHIIVSQLDAAANHPASGYHVIGTHDPRMAPQWKWLFGIAGGAKTEPVETAPVAKTAAPAPPE